MIEYSCPECGHNELDIKIRPGACCPKCGCSMGVEEEICEV
ncbi:hypothetical protein ACFTXL_00750 [Bacillus subtilis]|nr:hypothetical protein [Bacillus subtilis]MEC0451480.1 hypothetical protein [Bacillus subtilis]